jgi:ABC-type branched-subunit amino acid transport system substrate-binding protein
VQAQDIVLGQSVALSGSNADIGRDMRDGALAIFEKANASKLLGKHKIKLVTLDNGNERTRALDNTKRFLEMKDLVALFGYNSATTSLDTLPALVQNKMALFAPFSGSPSILYHPRVFTVRASYKDEAEKIIAEQAKLGSTKALVIYYDDDAGKANLEAVSQAFSAANKPRNLAVKRNAKLDAAVFDPIFKNPPQFVLITTQFSVVGDLQRVSAATGQHIPITALSFVNPDELAANLGVLARGTTVSQVMPSPRGANLYENNTVRDCAATLAAFNGSKLNYTSLESCIAAKTILRVIQKVGPTKITRETLLGGIEKAGRIDLNGFVLNFTNSNQGSQYVDLSILSRGNTFTR